MVILHTQNIYLLELIVSSSGSIIFLRSSFQSGVERKIQLYESRRCASGVVFDQKSLWLIGGFDDKGNAMTSTEFISLDHPPEKGPKLPINLCLFSAIQIDSKTIYLIGGHHFFRNQVMNGQVAINRTWTIDPTNNFELKEGPPLKQTIGVNSCATMRFNNKIFIVVVGNSVEILDTSMPSNGWKLGMYFLFGPQN